MAAFPWSELGLDGPGDERAIRRAYAARLKIVRPDVDAAGFQRLVQARDTALRAIAHTSQRPILRQIPRSDPVPKRDEAAPESRPTQPDSPDAFETRTQAPRFVDLDTSNSPDTGPPNTTPLPAEKPPQLEIELSTGSAPPAEKRPPPQSQSRPVTIDIDPPKPPPTVTEPEAKPPSATSTPIEQARAAAGPDRVLMLLSAFLDAWSKDQVLPPVQPILNLLGEQSIVARQKLEIEALRAAATLLERKLFDETTSTARQEAARSLILGLDDDYAWTSSDRRLYQMMPQTAADQIARLLRVVREWDKTGLAPRFGAPPQVQPRKKKQVNWASVAIGITVVLVLRGASLLAPKSSAPRFTPVVISQPYPPAVQPNLLSATFFFRQGVVYDNKGQIDLAIQEYDQATRLNPNYAEAFYNRGLDYANKGQLDRAIADYDQAVRLNPRNPDHFVSRGVAYDGKGQYDRAIQDYDQAIRLRPSYALAFVDRGIAYTNQAQYDRAIQDYDVAIRLNPNDTDALNNRELAKQAKSEAAAGDIAKAGQLNSPPPASGKD